MTTLTVPSTGPTPQQYATNGFRISLALALMVIGVVVYYTVVLPNTQLAYLAAVVAIAAMISALLCLRQQTGLGIGALALGVMIATIAQSAIQPGYGFSTGVTQVVVLYGVALFTLPTKLANRVLVAAAIVWLLITLFDVFSPPSSAVLDPIDRWTNIALVVIFVAIFGLLIANRYPSFSLRTKLIVVFVAISVVAVASLAVITSQVIQAELSTSVQRSLGSVARVTGRSLVESIQKRVATLQTFAFNSSVVDELQKANSINTGDTSTLIGINQQWRVASDTDPLVTGVLNNDLSNELKNYRASFPDNAEMLLTDRFGVLEAGTYKPEAYLQTNEVWWQAAYNGGSGNVYIGEPAIADNGVVGLAIATPVLDASRSQVIGILYTFVNLDAFAEVLTAGRFGNTGRAEIYLPDGHELEVEIEEGGSEVKLETAPADILAALTDEGAFFTTSHEGTPTVVGKWNLESADGNGATMSAINNLGWRIVALQDRSEAFESVIIAERITLLVSLAIIGVVILLAIVIAQALAKPITELTKVAEKVRAGDLSVSANATSNDEIGVLASTFNNMTAQLRGVLTGLEDRVADRTRALATSSEVSRRLSNILDQRQLVNEVVEQLHDAFNFYHVHIYLFDTKRENLLMMGGTGQAGQTMLERNHKIARGRGLVGRAAETNAVVLVPDVTQEANWLPNPLLPETKAEVAVPIAIGNVVAGVLDVQQNTVGGLKQEDAALIQSVANQVAIALQNIRAYTAAQHQADREALINTINQKIQRTETIPAAIEVAMRELVSALNAIRAKLQLLPSSGDTEILNGWRNYLKSSGIAAAYTQEGRDAGEDSMAVPPLNHVVAVRGEGIGQITLEGTDPLDDDAPELLESVVAQLVNHIENLRLSSQTQTALSETQLLYETSARLNAATTLEETLIIAAAPAMASGANDALLFIFDVDEMGRPEWMEVRANWAREDAIALPVGVRFFVSSHPIAQIWWTNPENAVIIDDPERDSRLDERLRSILAQQNLKAVVAMPLATSGKWIGLIVINWSEPHKFGTTDEQIYRSLGTQAAIVVDNRILFAQTQAALAESRQLYDASRRLAAAATLQEVVGTIVESAAISGIDRAQLVMFDRDSSGVLLGVKTAANWHSGHGIAPEPVGTYYTDEEIRGIGVYHIAEPTFLDDALTDPRVGAGTKAMFEKQKVRGVAALPMWIGGRQLGVFLLQTEMPHHFTEPEIRPLTSLVQQMAIAVENRQLFEQTQSALSETEELYKASARLNAAITPQETLQALAQALTQQSLSGANLYTFELDETGQPSILYTMVALERDGRLNQAHMGSRFKFSTFSYAHLWLNSNAPVIFEDLATDPNVSEEDRAMMPNVGALVLIPMKIGPRWIGLINLTWVNAQKFTDSEVRLFSSLGAQTATVLDNQLLFRETQKRAERETMLNLISQKIQSTTSVDGAVQAAVRELGQILRARRTVVQIGPSTLEKQISPAPTNGHSNGNGNGNGNGAGA